MVGFLLNAAVLLLLSYLSVPTILSCFLTALAKGFIFNGEKLPCFGSVFFSPGSYVRFLT